MFNFFKPKQPAVENAADADGDEPKLMCKKFAAIIVPQISQAGFEVGRVLPTGYSGIGPATGYVYGICVWLAVLHRIPEGDDRAIMLKVWAFDEIYGLMIGFPLLKETMSRFDADDKWVCHGVERARHDLLGMIEDKAMPVGFVWYASGQAFEKSK